MFPNFKDKHKCKELFTAKTFVDYKEKVGGLDKDIIPEIVIICYDYTLLNYIKENHECVKVKGIGNGRLFTLADCDHKIGVIGDIGVGAPVAVARLEELYAFGVKKFLSIGTAGTLQKRIPIGDIVVCDKAIRDEGTSYHYVEGSKYAYPSENFTKKLINKLKEENLKFHTGASWTTDAPYRETIDEIKAYQEEGIMTVEMEASALFAVAEVRGVEIAAMFTISDCLAKENWTPGFHYKAVKENMEKMFHVCKSMI